MYMIKCIYIYRHYFNVSQSYAMTASSIYSSPVQHQSG